MYYIYYIFSTQNFATSLVIFNEKKMNLFLCFTIEIPRKLTMWRDPCLKGRK